MINLNSANLDQSKKEYRSFKDVFYIYIVAWLLEVYPKLLILFVFFVIETKWMIFEKI